MTMTPDPVTGALHQQDYVSARFTFGLQNEFSCQQFQHWSSRKDRMMRSDLVLDDWT
ncbi:Uncharacterized protein DAT39_005028 [Clarias magur]|uniref:Uncharacterized protein n=1 Tax=Clarias magur TaxID=1594786 RepID=A0A8J4UMB1_CLAMG|nr:Uncharacterized protein DAT39_005028 [Clarias magur]